MSHAPSFFNFQSGYYMNNSIEIFKNDSFGEVRVVGTSEEPLFCLADVCRVLEIKNVSDCKARLDERGVVLTDTPTFNQFGKEVVQKLTYINEENLYKVITRSDKPQAESFQDWVCGEVLPSIRKTATEVASRNELKVISTSNLLGREINVYGSAENPLFLAKDVAEWIEYDMSSVNKLVNLVDDDEKVRKIVPTLGGPQEAWFLTEDGLYEILMQSRKLIARQFKKGIKEILKSIRKHGAYMTEQTLEQALLSPDYLIRLANQLKDERQRRIEAEEEKQQLSLENKKQAEQIAEDAPRVLFSKAVETAKRSCLMAELAKILQQNGVNIGQNRLFQWMRDNGYLCSKGQYYNQPTQKAMELGLFEIKQTTINKPDGTVLVSTTTKVTGKGQLYFVNGFLVGKFSI